MTERKKKAGLLQPFPIAERPWASVSMDFISGFPKEEGKGSSATEKSLFELVLGMQPNTSLEVAKSKFQGKCPTSYRYARGKQEKLDEAQDSLRKATRRMKKYADQHQRALEFQVGDEVEVAGKTFHVSFVKPFHEDIEHPIRSATRHDPPVLRTQSKEQIEKILDHRTLRQSKKNRRKEFLVQWKGKQVCHATWEKRNLSMAVRRRDSGLPRFCLIEDDELN
ncbi:hypothetical protein KY285_030174 [Solanum tuberosum]|nr:hypothetical protein KY285_030174 [Solanum tuberosum]